MKPLAYRMCPKNLDEYIGQDHILGKDKMLYRMVKTDSLSSIILWGPPGCGKTSLAEVISKTTKHKFYKLNAAMSGISDIKQIIDESKNFMLNPSGRAVVFIDEIHRFNKLQQDVLLPHAEDGTIILIGATTENPYFEVNKALLSRSTIFKLEPLRQDQILKILELTLGDKEKGFGKFNIQIEKKTLEFLAEVANGDVRTALNGLEIAVLSTQINSEGIIKINQQIVQESIQKKKIQFDKNGDEHYDNISAFIKSMRGSDADATVFYLARMLHAGEDPVFIARRILISASEDVGLANSNALIMATAALQAVQQVGMPEARIILSHVAIYIANSPKSNSVYMAINQALKDIEEKDTGTIPNHIKISGINYKYPHDYETGFVKQQYLPDKIIETKYYNATNRDIL